MYGGGHGGWTPFAPILPETSSEEAAALAATRKERLREQEETNRSRGGGGELPTPCSPPSDHATKQLLVSELKKAQSKRNKRVYDRLRKEGLSTRDAMAQAHDIAPVDHQGIGSPAVILEVRRARVCMYVCACVIISGHWNGELSTQSPFLPPSSLFPPLRPSLRLRSPTPRKWS